MGAQSGAFLYGELCDIHDNLNRERARLWKVTRDIKSGDRCLTERAVGIMKQLDGVVRGIDHIIYALGDRILDKQPPPIGCDLTAAQRLTLDEEHANSDVFLRSMREILQRNFSIT